MTFFENYSIPWEPLKGVAMPRVSLNQTAPDFSLPEFTGDLFKLSDLHGQKNVLLVFNRTFA